MCMHVHTRMHVCILFICLGMEFIIMYKIVQNFALMVPSYSTRVGGGERQIIIKK